MRQIAIHISKWYRSKGLYRTVQSNKSSRQQEEADADGDAHYIYREQAYIEANSLEPDHT